MYVLENKKEHQRLEKQSQIEQYSVKSELSKITFPKSGSVLDAGCGTGLLTSEVHQIFPSLEVSGCDISEDRIKFAKKKYRDLNFFQHDLINNPLENGYNLIVNRYVAHHLGCSDYKKVLYNFHNSLTSSGKLAVIDIENNIIGLGTTNEWLSSILQKINNQFYGDLLMGRKIPALMNEAGFKDINYTVEAMTFTNESLDNEREQIHSRLIFSKDFLINVIGNKKEYNKFVDLYMNELEYCAFFYNKIIIQGQK